jgi:hypothetical protein
MRYTLIKYADPHFRRGSFLDRCQFTIYAVKCIDRGVAILNSLSTLHKDVWGVEI